MKQLILTRHGKAAIESESGIDIDRPLAKKGEAQAIFIGQYLQTLNITVDQIIYSVAKRTTATYSILKEQLNSPPSILTSNSKLYLCSAQTIMDIIASETKDHVNTLLVIGHNNGLSDFFNQITNGPIYYTLSTCETAILNVAIDNWQDLYNAPAATIAHIIKPKI